MVAPHGCLKLHSQEGIGISVCLPWSRLYLEVVRLKAETPPCQASVLLFHAVKPCQGPVICLSGDCSAQEIDSKCINPKLDS